MGARRGTIGVALLAISTIAIAAVAPTAPAAADPPAPQPQPVLAPLALGQVMRIGAGAGTGTGTGDYGIGRADLCAFMAFPSGILAVGGARSGAKGVGYGGWYAPVALHVQTDTV